MIVYACRPCQQRFYEAEGGMKYDEATETATYQIDLCRDCCWLNKRIRFPREEPLQPLASDFPESQVP